MANKAFPVSSAITPPRPTSMVIPKAMPQSNMHKPGMPTPMHGMPKHKPGMVMDTAPMKKGGFQKVAGSPKASKGKC